jgi:Uma2 family endonuclease
MMAVIKRDEERHTYEDYLKWSRDYGDELIHGTAYVREPPSPTRIHQEIVGELHRQIANALLGKPSRVFVAPFDVRLPKADEEDGMVDTVVQPDLLIVSDLKKVDDRGVRGAPDWVAEILSPSTASYDRKVKVPVYEAAGVRELWLIRPVERVLTVYQLDGANYRVASFPSLSGQTPIRSVPGVTIDWNEVFTEAS